MNVARVGHTATRLKNGAVLIAGGRNGVTRMASSEIYIPRLPYDTSPIGIPRFGTDALGAFSYGTWLAAATNSHNNLLVSYGGGTGVASNLLEWDPRRAPDSFRQPGPRVDRPTRELLYLRSFDHNLPVLNSIRVDERDNIWAVSSVAQEVFKISPDGPIVLRFGRQESTESAEPSELPRTTAARQSVDNQRISPRTRMGMCSLRTPAIGLGSSSERRAAKAHVPARSIVLELEWRDP
jgi:hypothetical protein